MSVTVGRNAVIKIGTIAGSPQDASQATAMTGLVSFSYDAPDTIDVTVAGLDHKKMITGLKPGVVTAEVIEDGDGLLAGALVAGLTNGARNVYFYDDGGITPIDGMSWRAIVTADYKTGGPNDAAKRTVKFYCQFEVDPLTGAAA
jgi:hypothetical protein